MLGRQIIYSESGVSGLISSHVIETQAQYDAQHPTSNNTSGSNAALIPGILPPIQSLPQLNYGGINVTGMVGPATSNQSQNTQNQIVSTPFGNLPSNMFETTAQYNAQNTPLSQIAQAAQPTTQSKMIYNPNAMNGMDFNNYGQAGGATRVNWFNGGGQ